MDKMLDGSPSSATRAGLVFISAGFIYVQLMLNVAANSISAGCDLTALLPRFINIRRGGYIAALVGIVMNPWLLYKSSATFGNYLGAYGVLLSCIAGPMITDYWLVRKGHYRIADLYTTSREGWYWYTAGINWRGYLAYLV
jgi:NCS1 family nucleobase:cation symporter-1